MTQGEQRQQGRGGATITTAELAWERYRVEQIDGFALNDRVRAAFIDGYEAARAAAAPAVGGGDAGERTAVERRARAFLEKFRGNPITDADFKRLVEWEIALTLKQQQGARRTPDAGTGR